MNILFDLLGAALSGLGAVFLLGIIGALIGDFRLTRAEKKKKKAEPPVNAIAENVRWRHNRRVEERSKWDTDFYRVDHPRGPGGHVPYDQEDLTVLLSNYSERSALTMYRQGWDGRHHATCPYECDCPQRFRRFQPR